MEDRTPDPVERVEAAFLELATTPPDLTADAFSRARVRANGLLSPDPRTGWFGLATFAGSAMSALWLDASWEADQANELIAKLEARTGAPRSLIGLQALGNPDLLALPLLALATVEVEALMAFGRLDHVSLWAADDDGVECLVQRGPRPQDAAVLASAALAGESVAAAGSRATPVRRWQRDHAVLVAQGAAVGEAEPLLVQAAAMLSPAFERASLVERNVSGREALAQSAERRLRRLGFDLHDGPVQDVLALGAEMSRLSEQLDELELGPRAQQLLEGRMDDLRAYLTSIETDLREFSSSLESPVLVARPFEEALRGAVWTFTSKSDLQPSVLIEGDVDALTDTQRITLYRIVQEALSNICDHSNATEVSVELRVLHSHIALEITDDGVGFDLDTALMEASRRGHIGLLGMMERVRLIGGDLQIRSRAGGPTKLEVKLAHWRPGPDAAAPLRATGA
ncbi:MAG TPA: ATP-binding protein [Candidatus Limnocylindria bacterium]|nr:ATP-binding protein [Candidatus Limnocylindria bacterium]